MSLIKTIKEVWNDLRHYEPTEENQRALWRVELNMLYDRVAYLEDKLSLGKTPEEDAQALRIKRCTHAKGGRGPRVTTDYNVGCHTFIDGKTKIWCLNGCGFESWTGDANWEKACGMCEQSTNTASSSETPTRDFPFPNIGPILKKGGFIKLGEDESPIKGALKTYRDTCAQEIEAYCPDPEQK